MMPWGKKEETQNGDRQRGTERDEVGTDREAQRQTERHRERQNGDRQRGIETDRGAQRETEWGQTERHRDR